MTQLIDGTGKGFRQKVNENNRAYVNSINESEKEAATDLGNSYNINTGDITFTSANKSDFLYLKNNEDQTLVVTGFAVGAGSMTAPTAPAVVTLSRNPTAVSFSNAVAQNQNRNFGSSKTLSADIYTGVEAGSHTGGNDIAQFYMNNNSRLFAEIEWELPKGDSIVLSLDPNNPGGVTAYAAFICHLKDPKA